MKQLPFLLFFLFYLIVLFHPTLVHAQRAESNEVSTRVGNPPVASGSGTLGTVLEWDTQIVDALKPGIWGYLNNLSTAISNGEYGTGTWSGANEGTVYWCTYSIVDSYNLAGIKGLTKGSHAAVVTMRNFWKGAGGQGYHYVDYSEGDWHTKVKPGYAIFYESIAGTFTGREHVAMLKEISIDSHGNGTIITQDSNSSARTRRFVVALGNIVGAVYPVRGFGGINN